MVAAGRMEQGMLEGIASILPLLILIVIGFVCAKQPWFGPKGMDFLTKFNLDIAIPLYLFYSVTRTYSRPSAILELVRNVQYPAILILFGMVVGFVICLFLGIRAPQRSVFINAVSLSNVVVMGLPVVASLFGERVLPIAMVYYACNSLLYWTVGVWLLRRDAGRGGSIGVWGTIKTVFLSRPLLGLMAGVAWVCLGLSLPQFAVKSLGMISSAVTPLAMVFIGSVIRYADFRNIGNSRLLAFIVGYRLLIVPLVAGALCSLFPVSVAMKKVFFILSNMPSMAQLPIMSKEVGGDYELASLTTAVTTALSMIAVPVYVFLMNYYSVFD